MSFHLSRLSSLLLLSSALVATAALTPGCAEPRAPINRVQPGAIQRSVFEGEWYFQQTVIDSPYSAGYTFVGEQGELERVRWEIQEGFLVARRAYEHIAGSEDGGISGEGTELGAPIAMYAIESHFDIRHDYNPLTGERLNVIVENSTDRPWYERDYVRVDWSENLITNSDFLVLARIFDAIETEPVAYAIEEPSHPHAPRFEAQDEAGVWAGVSVDQPVDGEVEYIDVVNKMFVRPDTVDIEGLGPVPSCFLLYQGHYDCAPGEITVRNSFLRVDHEDTDYEPQVYSGDRMERFGYFVTERAGYDDQYGVVEPARVRFANRHNLWMESHRKDAEGELVRCLTTRRAAAAAPSATSISRTRCAPSIPRPAATRARARSRTASAPSARSRTTSARTSPPTSSPTRSTSPISGTSRSATSSRASARSSAARAAATRARAPRSACAPTARRRSSSATTRCGRATTPRAAPARPARAPATCATR